MREGRSLTTSPVESAARALSRAGRYAYRRMWYGPSKGLLYVLVFAVFFVFIVISRYDQTWYGPSTPAVPLFQQQAQQNHSQKGQAPRAQKLDEWVVQEEDLKGPIEKLNDLENLKVGAAVESGPPGIRPPSVSSKIKSDPSTAGKASRITAKKTSANNNVKYMPLKSRTIYPKRLNMGACPPLFGKVTVFVAFVKSSYETHYKVAQDSLRCYLASTNYTVLFVDLYNDKRVQDNCPHDQLFFKKHCAASVYLEDSDWMLVLDADAGVVNPNHCIEEYIDDRVDLIFYERFFNWEIASGNYLARNSDFARDFLRRWADWQYTQPSNWNGADNGVLQMHILQTVLPDAKAEIKACDRIWHRGTGYETYMAYVTCVKVMLGAVRIFPGKLRIMRRGHAFIRDGFITSDGWSPFDFMLHGWKHQKIGDDGWTSPYSQMFNQSECGHGFSGWHYIAEKRLAESQVRLQMAAFEKSTGSTFPKEGRVHPYLSEPDVGECYPHCDDDT